MTHTFGLTESAHDDSFEITVCSNHEYEELIAEVAYKGYLIARLTDENVEFQFLLELHNCPLTEHWTFRFEDFQRALLSAAEKLRAMGTKRPRPSDE